MASRSKPPQPAPGANWVGWIKRNGSAKTRHRKAKLAVVRIQADCLAANPPYG
nr:hypothetical protein [Methylomarinum sp. Ch1-1]MDP4521366.1 hypothetical protein [Methylomarinum sp. Ch1-1]